MTLTLTALRLWVACIEVDHLFGSARDGKADCSTTDGDRVDAPIGSGSDGGAVADAAAVSPPVDIETPDKAVTVAFKEGDAARVSFAIEPRFPKDAKLIALVFDTLAPDPEDPDKVPLAKLFLTGDDPLVGAVSGGGVLFTAQ